MRRGLRERYLSRLGLISAGLLLVLGAILAGRNEIDYRRDSVSQVTAQADVLAASATAALAFDDRATLDQYVRALSANRRIGSAAIYAASGQRLAQSVQPGEPQTPVLAPPATERWSEGRATAIRAASERGQTLGLVFLQSRRDTPAAMFGRHTGVALLTVMALLLVVLVSAAGQTLQRRAAQLAAANARLQDEMTARAAAEEALRQSQKMEALGQLTGGIAHDFNNLLQVIIGALDILRRRAGDPVRVEGLARNALEAAERGATLTRQLLAFSRTQKLDVAPFVLADLVAGMNDILTRSLGPTIELVLDLDAQGVAVLSDRTQIELAVLNLAINARDAMPEGGVLIIRTFRVDIPAGDPSLAAGGYVALAVSDNGLGMTAETAQRAFDPFFTTKSVGQGTGLGLSQVYGLARQAGGGAKIASVEGEGTTVTLFLRAADETALPVETTDSAEVQPVFAARKGATVLVVDDDDAVRTLLVDTLQMLGYEVMQTNSGATALEMVAARCPDAAVLDFAMPQMNGAQVAERLRQLCPQLPVLFASGHADTEAIRQTVGDKAVILKKPFNMDVLGTALGKLITEPTEPT